MHELPDETWLDEQRRATGERIRVARLYANLTQQALAERAGIERRQLQRIEAGITDARLSWLLRITHALQVPLTDLLRGEP